MTSGFIYNIFFLNVNSKRKERKTKGNKQNKIQIKIKKKTDKK